MSSRNLDTERTRHRLDRLQQVSALRLAGVYDQRVIAGQVGVDRSTISRDFATLDRLYQQEAAANTAAMKGRQLQRLERLVLGLWPAATRGDVRASLAVLALLEREAKLLGLDAPQRVDIEQRIRAVAVQYGLDPDAAVAEAQRVIEEQRRDAHGGGA